MTDPELIVVLDTNALHGDVHAQHQDLSTLFDACDSGLLDDVIVWTPRGVVEELVRQYGERLTRMQKVLGAVKRDLGSFGLSVPEVPDPSETEIASYRGKLEARLTSARRSIAANPATSERIVTWAAQRRKPIKAAGGSPLKRNEPDPAVLEKKPKTQPLYGVVDAAIWLTVIEAVAASKRVAFITSNTGDFADNADKSKPSPMLAKDLEDAGLNPGKLEVFLTVRDFNDRYIEPLKAAQERAKSFLDDGGKLEALKAEISDAAEWLAVPDSGWDFGVEVDEVTLAGFDPSAIVLLRADPAPGEGLFMALRVHGDGRFDLGIRKEDAINLSDDGPVSVNDWDWNESMVAAEAEIRVRITVEARLSKPDEDGNEELSVSIDDIDPD